MKRLDKLTNQYFDNSLEMSELLELISEQLESSNLNKKLLKEERFSMSIDIPTWTPSEAWGDPDSQDRETIQKIFSVVRGGTDMKARIADINKFLDPRAARRKRSPSVIINMMMIVEALQATLNDYNESAAGFVFEGFMAALTGGKQIAGKVEGTLPIEDFVAFSAYGPGVPVSLKLLSGKTPIKGSFTNIVDFLLVRGAPAIKYLVAYKLTTGGDVVQKINIYAFDITRENFVDFISQVGGGASLLRGVDLKQLRAAFQSHSGNAPSEELARMVTSLGGYSDRGLLHKILRGQGISKPTPDEADAAEKAATARREKDYWRTRKFSHPEEYKAWQDEQRAARKAAKAAEKAQALNEAIDQGELTINEAFHYIEKYTMAEKRMLSEGKGGDDKSQWAASLSQLEGMSQLIQLEPYGELDLSQSNIDELAEIYAEKLKGGVMTLLTEAKSLTENIGSYYTEKRRSKATAAASTALENTEKISDVLAEDPRYK